MNRNPLDKAPGKNENPEQGDFCSENNESSPSSNATSGPDESDVEGILRSHPPPGTYPPPIEPRGDSLASSHPDPSSEEEEEEQLAPKGVGQGNPGADDTNLEDPSTRPEPGHSTAYTFSNNCRRGYI